ncbi:hypothetical protein FRC08_000048 [Ceratobasidium sp. 394]|nr:hypothetical protein FRC08_000048 [Ceratobasidium sp. 394]
MMIDPSLAGQTIPQTLSTQTLGVPSADAQVATAQATAMQPTPTSSEPALTTTQPVIPQDIMMEPPPAPFEPVLPVTQTSIPQDTTMQPAPTPFAQSTLMQPPPIPPIQFDASILLQSAPSAGPSQPAKRSWKFDFAASVPPRPAPEPAGAPPRKRLRNSEYKPSGNPDIPPSFTAMGTGAIPQAATPGVGSSNRLWQMPHVSSPNPGPNAGGTNVEDKEGEDSGKGCDVERDEIIQKLYEGNTDNDNSADMRQMCRLLTRMFQKQDAILKGLQQSRPTPGGSTGPPRGSGAAPLGDSGATPTENFDAGSTPDHDQPPRVSPYSLPNQVNWDQGVAYTQPAGRQPRLARRILLLKEIRATIMKLLGCKDYKPPLPAPPANSHFPTADNFGIRWEEKEKSLFNRLAANVVVEQFIRNWEGSELTASERDGLPRMVTEHIRYLCRIQNDSGKPDAASLKKAALLQASSSSRRQTLYNNRLKVLDHFPGALGKHRHLIVRLGLPGTSSDEEDPDHLKVFLIRRQKELSSKVQVLKRISKLDLVHARVASDKVSKRPLNVEGLPVTCLNRAWVRSLSAPEREFYRFEPHDYDYTFPDALLKHTNGRTPDDIIMSEEEDINIDDEEL